DLLKSPFIFGDVADKSAKVMAIELALRSANVPGGWDAVDAALADAPTARELLSRLARQAKLSSGGRKALREWLDTTHDAMDAIGMRAVLAADAAGAQVIALLDTMEQDCRALDSLFSFA